MDTVSSTEICVLHYALYAHYVGNVEWIYGRLIDAMCSNTGITLSAHELWNLLTQVNTRWECPHVSLQCTNWLEEDVRCTAALSLTQFPRLFSGVHLASLLLVSCGFSVVATAPVHRANTELLKQLLWLQIHSHILNRCNTLEKEHRCRLTVRANRSEGDDSRPDTTIWEISFRFPWVKPWATRKPLGRTWAQSQWP